MSAKTYHVYPSDKTWTVKKEGVFVKTYRTRNEAIKAARLIAKQAHSGQLVVHGRDGEIRDYKIYGLTPIQDPPKKSRFAKRIGRAVGRVALRRVKSDGPQLTSAVSPKK